MRKAGSTQKWVKEEQSLNFFLTKNNSGKHISRENCLKTFTVHHIHQDWFWLVDTAESACSDASNFIGMLHKNLYKKVSIDGARKERVRWRKSKRGREKQILRNRDNRNTYLSSTEISAVCRQNVRVWEVGLHYFLFRITCALSTFPWLWCGSWSLRMLSIEKTWRSDMRNVMRKKRLEPGLTLSQQEREREKYMTHVLKIEVRLPISTAASAWQMTLLSLSWAADMSCLNSERNIFICYCFSDIPDNPPVAKLQWWHSK